MNDLHKLFNYIGIIIGVAGLILQWQILIMAGGFVGVFYDVLALIEGKMKIFLPAFLYFIGFLFVGSYIGIFYGAIVHNLIRVSIPIISSLFKPKSIIKSKRLFSKKNDRFK